MSAVFCHIVIHNMGFFICFDGIEAMLRKTIKKLSHPVTKKAGPCTF